MTRSRLLLIVTLALVSCSWGGGPDCPKACQIAQDCTGLHATYRLSCSNLAGGCYDQTADCAACITTPGVTCADLIAGKCDPVCLVDGDGGQPDAGPDDAGPGD